MAKSIRSKWRRKCRAVKRERYGKKELDRLKKTLGIDESNNDNEIKMNDVSDIVTITDAKTIQKNKEIKKLDKQLEGNEEMETDSKKRIFNPKTLKDQHGSYPVWMHPRKIHKSNKKNNKKGKSKKKR